MYIYIYIYRCTHTYTYILNLINKADNGKTGRAVRGPGARLRPALRQVPGAAEVPGTNNNKLCVCMYI